MLKLIRSIKWGYLLIALFAALFGVLLVILHDMLHYVALTVGCCLILFSVVLGIQKAVSRDRGFKFGCGIVMAVMALISGVVTVVFYQNAGMIVADVLCLVMLVDGSLKLGTAIESIRNRFFGRWVMLVLSLLVIVSSFLLTKTQPEDLGIYLGIVMLTDALINALTTVFAARNEKRVKENILKAMEEPPKV
ncbi:MAG: hypothetical protein IKC63_06440 [Clostridia bacterium]|nr:hypothetical protein [Clostridia bacterium]